MKKSSLLFIFILIGINAQAQTGEVFVGLNSLAGYNYKIIEDNSMNDISQVNDFSYLTGYNHFMKNDLYVGLGIGYNSPASTTKVVQSNVISITTTFEVYTRKYYNAQLHIGKLNKYKRFRLYSQLAITYATFRKLNIAGDRTVIDSSNVQTSLAIVEVILPNEHRFGLHAGQGVYYKLYKGLYIGADLNMTFNYTKVKGEYTSTEKTNGQLTIDDAQLYNNTAYDLGFVPILGLKYVFK